MKRETIKEVLVEALDIFMSGKHYGMCLCIEDALLARKIRIRFLTQITRYVPEFNIQMASKLFGASDDPFWWNTEDRKIRIDYFNYLIKLYTDEKSSTEY